jgi:hypothetical protein
VVRKGNVNKICVGDVRKLGGVTLPGERCKYAGPFNVPDGWLEVYGLVKPRYGTPYITWHFGPATPQALRYAFSLRLEKWKKAFIE